MKNTPKLLSFKNLFVTSPPKERPTPRLLGPLPGRGCGSLHNNSHINPTHAKHRCINKVTIQREIKDYHEESKKKI
jgi:hypothetical protein